jgi:hypothetical protein
VRERIESGSDDIGISGIGRGRINAYRAVAGDTTVPAPTTGAIAGIAQDASSGSPIAGATVSAGAASAVTDASGAYTILNVPQGSYSLTGSATGYSSATQAATVTAGQIVSANFALTALPPPVIVTQSMWVQSIAFAVKGKNLGVTVKTASAAGALPGANVNMVVVSGTQSWSFSGMTDSTGAVSFNIQKPLAGSYLATVTGLTGSGYQWDATQGVTSASYTVAATNTNGRPSK